MSLPLVSIIIPVYNQRSDFLRECLKSAINQTYSNIEVIVSDNHSTNESIQVLEEFPKNQFRTIKPHLHLGMVDHFSFAGSAANGEYITFLSSDDLLYPECIAKVLPPLIENKDLSLSYCDNAIIDESGKQQKILRKRKLLSGIYSRKKIGFRMYNYSEYWIIGGILRTAHFKKLGFEREIRVADWILGFQLLKYGNVAYINEVLSAIRIHERKGDEKRLYAEADILANMQRAAKHEFIINDKELLDQIGISKEKAIAYRNKEILGSVIVLIRKYHKDLITRENIKRVFDFYRQSQSGFNFKLLTRFYASGLAVGYTYFLGLLGRIKKLFSPNS